jgi:hydroxymethylpyrimidine pyrophosphatase-like HAD family hydrolase
VRYLAFACDYDGTIAHHGRVDSETIAALGRVKQSGRKLLLVTGRELDDLLAAFPEATLFDCIVAENGALLYWPETRQEQPLGPVPPEAFVAALRERQVQPLGLGRVIVATWEPNQQIVLDTIRALGLELQVIFNKGAVMVLPAGVNKRTGLEKALDVLGLSLHNTIGIGDAENDHAFLTACECAVAVANALDSVKGAADFVTGGHHGAGVCELIQMLLKSDLAELEPRLQRHHILLGTRDDGSECKLRPYGTVILIAGVSGGGKSTAAKALLERVTESRYQFCLVDPEGDYDGFEDAVRAGSADQSPDLEQVFQILSKPHDNGIVNLLGLPLADRAQFFQAFLPRLHDFHAASGRPHWLVVDEAHHMLHQSFRPTPLTVLSELDTLLLITVHPGQIYSPLLERVDVLVAVGNEPAKTLEEFALAAQVSVPAFERASDSGKLLVWDVRQQRVAYVTITKSRKEHRRHLRKYAEGELGPDKSFYFRGPKGLLNLRAQNLILFNQIAEGIDDETWLFHLQNGDISRWFDTAIKDPELAALAAELARHSQPSVAETRQAVRDAIEKRYTLPAR